MVPLLRPLYRLLETPGAYALNQYIARPTTNRCRLLLDANLRSAGATVLDLGCGIGNFRDCFRGPYVGIDINPQYIDAARIRFPDRFEVMDATDLKFPAASFDEVVTIETTHHFDDHALGAMVSEALRVLRPSGHLHILDAILPLSPRAVFKRVWFNLDRGGYPRDLESTLAILRRFGRLSKHDTIEGPLHDVAYIQIGHP